MQAEAPESSKPRQRPGDLILKGVLALVPVLILAAVAGSLLREPLEAAGAWMVLEVGEVGLWISVLLVDAVPTPLSFVPLQLLALQGGMPASEVWLCTATASIVAGPLGYSIGYFLGLPDFLRSRLEQWRPDSVDWLKERGGWGVAIVGSVPLPFALGTWTAGALRVPMRQVLLASLVRIPKTGVYLLILGTGLSLGGS